MAHREFGGVRSGVRGGARRARLTGSRARLLSVVVALLAAVLGVAGPAAALAPAAPQPLPDRPLVGVRLNWATDSAGEYASRAGQTAALYEHDLQLPLFGTALQDLRGAVVQAAGEGAGMIVTVRPVGGLATFDDGEAARLAESLRTAVQGLPGPLFVRFAPQMNAPWEPWGLQPTAYAEAFRRAAGAVRAVLPDAALVWSPHSGEGYPFPETAGPAAPRLDPAADTNGDGALTADDDPYAPYFPGDDAVDWVGLDTYADTATAGTAAEGRLAQLIGAAAGPDPSGFYQRYASGAGRPLMLMTGVAAEPGDAGIAAKEAWWKQAAGLRAGGYAQLGAVVWQDTVSRRADGSTADWRTTATPALAQAFRSQLEAGGLQAGRLADPATLAGGKATGTTLSGGSAWLVVGTVAALALAVWALGLTVPSQRYAEEGKRDLRVDFLRGIAIVFVVVDHLGLPSLFQLLSHEAIGVVSGAELFVFLSGGILGLVSRPRITQGIYEAVDRGWSRAGKLYLWALIVTVTVFALSRIPWITTTPATTFTDEGTGAAGGGAQGTTYDLFAGMDQLLQYPVPPEAVPRFFLLNFGPWQFNIMGLYVVLLLASPLILAAIRRGWTWAVLAGSALLYTLNQIWHVRVLPFQSADAFPLLSWQILFVLGLVTGYHLTGISAALRQGWGRVAVLACVVAAAAFMLFSWNNPFLSNPYDLRLGLIGEEQFRAVYEGWFERTFLEPGRLVNVLVWVVAAYWVLTAFWRPLRVLFGWLLIPLGQATLYVFILHVFLVVVVANVPFFQQGDVLVNTLAYVLVLLGLWAMVKTRFLFNIIPR